MDTIKLQDRLAELDVLADDLESTTESIRIRVAKIREEAGLD